MTHTVRILAIAILTSAAAGSAIVATEAGEARSQQSTTQAVPRTNGERAEADATQINPVTVDLLHDQAERYLGQTVFLDAEVAEIFGPRLFTVAERNFGATPSLLVVVPEGLAAGVREHDHITLRGTIRRFDPSRFAGQWGWFPLDAATGRRFHGQIVLDASRIGGERVLMLAASTQAPTVAAHEIPPSPTGTAGKPDERSAVVLTDAARVATATDAAIGRSVELQNLGVSGLAAGGFLVNAGPAQLFVLPGARTTYSPAIGDHVNLQGVLLRVWPGMRSSIRKTARTNGDVYVLATKVSKP